MAKKIQLYPLVVIVILLLVGCSGKGANAILGQAPSNPAESTGEKGLDQEEIELEGEWTRSIPHHNGSLNIMNVTNDNFDFELIVAGGGNTGFIEGKARLSGKIALFEMEDSMCEIDFELNNDIIDVTVTEECQGWGGNGTFFHGEYQKGVSHNKTDLTQQGILTDREDKLFKAVVGTDYPLFVENMMIIYEEKDADGLQARVITGAVRGVATYMRAIIMISDEYVYAAVPGDESFSLYYYTNDPNYKKSVPLTIEQWINDSQMFQNVIYK